MTEIVALTDDRKEEALALIESAFGAATADEHRTLWDWKIRENPDGGRTEEWRIGLVDNGALIGVQTLMPARIKIGPEVHSAAYVMDVVIAPSSGEGGVVANALDLSEEALRRSPALVCGNCDDRISRLWRLVCDRDVVMARLHIYHRFLSISPALRANLRLGRVLTALADAAYRAAAAFVDAVAALSAPRDIAIRAVDDFDPAFDVLWTTVSQSHRNLKVRDRRFLSWRFRRMPARRYTVLGAYRDDQLVGYVVLRFLQNGAMCKARIVDILTHRNNVGIFRKLLGAAIGFARQHGAASVTMLETCQPDLQRQMRLSLFFAGRSTFSITAHSLTLPASNYADPATWWITFADCDFDFALE